MTVDLWIINTGGNLSVPGCSGNWRGVIVSGILVLFVFSFALKGFKVRKLASLGAFVISSSIPNGFRETAVAWLYSNGRVLVQPTLCNYGNVDKVCCFRVSVPVAPFDGNSSGGDKSITQCLAYGGTIEEGQLLPYMAPLQRPALCNSKKVSWPVGLGRKQSACRSGWWK